MTVLGAGRHVRTSRGIFLPRPPASQEPVPVCGAETGGSNLTATVSAVAMSGACCQCLYLVPLPPWVLRIQVVRAMGALDTLT